MSEFHLRKYFGSADPKPYAGSSESYCQLWANCAEGFGARACESKAKLHGQGGGSCEGIDGEILDLFEALLLRWSNRVYPQCARHAVRPGSEKIAASERFRAWAEGAKLFVNWAVAVLSR